MFTGIKRKLMKKLKNNWITKTPSTRLYSIPVPIVGLTGGIATGKSTVAEFLRKNNIPVIDADQLVKNVYLMNETKKFIQETFPKAVDNGEIVFKKLREIAFSDVSSKKTLEDYIYAHLPDQFSKAYLGFKNPSFIVYDVPLLFEKKLNELVDVTVCVYASRQMQIIRLMARDHIERDLAEKILDNQMDIENKKKLADLVIFNTEGPDELNFKLKQFIEDLTD